MMKVDDAIVDALRNEKPLPSAKLEALRTFTLEVVRQRGAVTDEQVETFFAAGYAHNHVLDVVLDVVLGVAQKVMSNYVNNIAQTPIDDVVKQYAWEKATS